MTEEDRFVFDLQGYLVIKSGCRATKWQSSTAPATKSSLTTIQKLTSCDRYCRGANRARGLSTIPIFSPISWSCSKTRSGSITTTPSSCARAKGEMGYSGAPGTHTSTTSATARCPTALR